MAQQSILITQVGSDFAEPGQYTAASPSLSRYRMTSSMVTFGDAPAGTAASYTGGPVPLGFIYVQFHTNNQWKTGTLYTSQTGAQIKTLVEA